MSQFNSFQLMDYLRALDACAGASGANSSAVDDYLFERRRRELSALVRRVIREQLNDDDRRLVVLRWYRQKSATEIATTLGLDRSTVFRRLGVIERKLYDSLKYAVAFRYGTDVAYDRETRRTVKDLALTGFDLSGGVGDRLKGLRDAEGSSISFVCQHTGLTPTRLQALEANGQDLTLAELSLLCAYYQILPEALLCGCFDANDPNKSPRRLRHDAIH